MIGRICFVLCILLLLSGCSHTVEPLNQKQDVASPSQAYIASVKADLRAEGNVYWSVEIENTAGNIVYKDTDKELMHTVPVYWVWDAADKLWLYSAETGAIYVFVELDGSWQKHFWGTGKTRIYKEAIQPPDELFPPYLKAT